MSNLRLPPRRLMLTLTSPRVVLAFGLLLLCASGASGQMRPEPGGDRNGDPRTRLGVGGYPMSKDEMLDPQRSRQRSAKRMAGSVISDGRKALREDPPDYLKARQLFIYAARLSPEDERAYLGLGDVNVAMRRYPEAVSAYARAAQLNEKSAEAHYGLGVVYHAQGKNDAAQDELQVLRSLRKKELVARLEALLNQ